MLNEYAVVRGTQFLVLSTTGLEIWISDRGTQLKRRLRAENPRSDLEWTVAVAKTWRKGWVVGADAGGRAAGWTHAALHRSVQGQRGGGADAAAGGGGHGCADSGEGEGLRRRENGSVV